MYLDGLSFLEDERDAWAPFEALLDLPDDLLDRKVEAAHGWSARDLMAHLVGWQEWALAMARDLAIGEASPTLAQLNATWQAEGDAMNEAMLERFAALPVGELRERFRTVSGELRGYLTVVPEARWVKNPANFEMLHDETLGHYEDHLADLDAILEAAGR